jgi:hypothetical protein
MGNLVFQATLGGQVNLAGPNTASTFTVSVPATTGTMVTTGDTGTVTSTMISGPLTGTVGGTGVNNGSSTITIAGNLTHAGAFTQSFTATGNTAVTLPTSGTLMSSSTALSGAVTGTPSSSTYLRGDATWATVGAMTYPGAGIANSTGSAWGTSYTTTGSGTVVALATSPSFTTPVLGTPTSGNLSTCTADGTNAVGYRNIPLSGTKTASYTLVAGDVGKFIILGTSGLVVIPASVFAVGDAISVVNNTTAAITCTSSAITAYLGGTNTVVTSFSLATRGVCTILFVTTTVVVITGNVS